MSKLGSTQRRGRRATISASLFSTKVRWDLTPAFGFPLQDRVEDLVLPEPLLGAGHQMEQSPVFGRLRQFRFALFPFHPSDTNPGIGVNRSIRVTAVLQQGQSMDNGKEFPDVHCAIGEGTLVKQLHIAFDLDTLILQRPGVSFTGRVDSDRRGIDAKCLQILQRALRRFRF